MSISFMSYIRDVENDIWCFPAAARANPDDFEMSVCNANGIDILLALGLDPDPAGGPIPIEAFSSLVTAALRRHLGKRSPELAAVEDRAPGRMTIIFGGRDEGYVERRLGDLATLVQLGRAAGATHIGWG